MGAAAWAGGAASAVGARAGGVAAWPQGGGAAWWDGAGGGDEACAGAALGRRGVPDVRLRVDQWRMWDAG